MERSQDIYLDLELRHPSNAYVADRNMLLVVARHMGYRFGSDRMTMTDVVEVQESARVLLDHC